jgi:hypothetical protein
MMWPNLSYGSHHFLEVLEEIKIVMTGLRAEKWEAYSSST